MLRVSAVASRIGEVARPTSTEERGAHDRSAAGGRRTEPVETTTPRQVVGGVGCDARAAVAACKRGPDVTPGLSAKHESGDLSAVALHNVVEMWSGGASVGRGGGTGR